MTDAALKAELMAMSASWSALAVVADWQDVMDAKINGDRPGVLSSVRQT
jgi:hypothetical protein